MQATINDSPTPLWQGECENDYTAQVSTCPNNGTVSGSVTCPLMGTILAATDYFKPGVEWASTLVVQNGGIYNCQWGPTHTIQYCDVAVVPWCSNTSNPDHNPKFIHDEEYPIQFSAWWSEALCTRLFNASPWVCAPGIAKEAAVAPTVPPPAVCTYNP